MIALDTNVVSEALRPLPSPLVMAWFARNAGETLHLPATVKAELLVGIATMPPGKRRAGLQEALAAFLDQHFGRRVLPFDGDAASTYATLIAAARQAGAAVSMGDAQIAAIAAVHGLPVATRDAAPFRAMGVAVIDPWRSGS